MFRVILQKHKNVLRSIVCACLKLEIGDVQDIVVQNPSELGEAIDDKTFILDINVLLNNNTIINLEMQVLDLKDWPERSLSYLARSYDNVAKGDEYINVKPVYHIGFLNYTLFPESPEFFARYRMMNIKNHHIYTTKFNLYVVDLTQIKLATQEDYYNHERGTQKRLEEARTALEESKAVIAAQKEALENQKKNSKKDKALLKKSVKLLAEKLHISEAEACKQIGISIEDYQKLK